MARERPGLQLVFDDDALLSRERAVMRLDEILATLLDHALLERELVEARRESLGRPTGVAEHDRRAVLEDELQQARMHRGPDAATQRSGGGGAAHRLLDHLAECAHVFDGDDDLDVERLADARVDDRDGPRPLCGAAAEEASDLVERSLRRGQPDALERSLGDLLEPFERQREVRAALGRRERVDLVDDHGLDPAERVARGRREHQEQATRAW